MNRTIEIRVAEGVILNPHTKSLQSAIGYLSMWGNSDHVILYIDKDYNIEASHQRASTPPNALEDIEYRQYYFIAGVYNAKEDTYSFHS